MYICTETQADIETHIVNKRLETSSKSPAQILVPDIADYPLNSRKQRDCIEQCVQWHSCSPCNTFANRELCQPVLVAHTVLTLKNNNNK